MIALVFYAWCVWYNRGDKWAMAVWPIVGTLFVWCITTAMAAGITSECLSTYTTFDVTGNVWKIRTMAAVDRYRGSFVLGSGTIESIDYYYFISEQSPNRWMKQRVKAEGTLISEVDGQPNLSEHIVFKFSKLNAWFPGINWFLDHQTYYVFEVPKGTIVE